MQVGIEAIRVRATTPDDIPTDMMKMNCDPTKLQHVTQTELACTLSHRSIWQRIVSERLPWSLVLEDDAILSSGIAECVHRDLGSLDGLDVVKLETRGMPVLLDAPDGNLVPGIALRRIQSFHFGAVGYLLSLGGARKLIAAEEYYNMPADDLLFSPELPVFHSMEIRQAVPALCISLDVLHRGEAVGISSMEGGLRSRRAALVRARRSIRMPELLLRRYWALFAEYRRERQCIRHGGARVVVEFHSHRA